MHCRCTDRHSFQAITLVDKDKPGENNKRVSQANARCGFTRFVFVEPYVF
jgi:hypothetical protein